jgi:hypothetical protein
VWFSLGKDGRFLTHHKKKLLGKLSDDVVDGAKPTDRLRSVSLGMEVT